MNFIPSILVAIFLSAAICQSITVLGISPREEEYWDKVSRLVSELHAEQAKPGGLDPQKRRQLEQLLQSNNEMPEAEKLMSEDWATARVKVKGADSAFRTSVLNHAAICADEHSYVKAIDDLRIILERDRFYNPGKVEVGIDLNDLGVECQLSAINSADTKKKDEFCKEAIAYYRAAETEFRTLRNNDALFRNLANQYSLLHEMNDKKGAKEVFAKLKQADLQPHKEFREMVIEQQ